MLPEVESPPRSSSQMQTLIPPTRIAIDNQGTKSLKLKCIYLLARGTNKNMTLHQTWNLLGKGHLDSCTKIILHKSHPYGSCIEFINVSLSINSQSKNGKLFVMSLGHLDQELEVHTLIVYPTNKQDLILVPLV